jgi:hypothetical protein
MPVLILYTAPHTSTAYQSMKAVPKLGYFRIILKIVVAFQLTITGNPEVLLSTDYHGNQ